MVEQGLAGAAGQRGDLGQRYEFRGQMPRLDSNLEIYIAIKRLVLPPLAHRPDGSSGRWPPDLEPQFFTGGKTRSVLDEDDVVGHSCGQENGRLVVVERDAEVTDYDDLHGGIHLLSTAGCRPSI